MRYYTIIFLLVGAFHLLSAQQRELEIMAPHILTGKWVGELIQLKGGIAKRYPYEIEIILEGTNIKGKGTIKAGNMFGKFRMRGTLDGDNVFLEDVEITNEKIKTRSYWCIKTMPLKLLFKNGKYCLEGNWSGYAPTIQCLPGRIYLKKSAIKA